MRVAMALVFSISMIVIPYTARAQSTEPTTLSPAPAARPTSFQQQPNVPPAARQLEEDVEDVVRRFRVGVEGGVGFDPELIMFGGHAAFAPVFHRRVEFRPGFEIGIGELTTL